MHDEMHRRCNTVRLDIGLDTYCFVYLLVFHWWLLALPRSWLKLYLILVYFNLQTVNCYPKWTWTEWVSNFLMAHQPNKAIQCHKLLLYLFSATHTRWKERNDGKHVLQWIKHSNKRHHTHRQRVVVTWLKYNLDHTDRSTQPSTLRGTVKWVVTHLHGLRKVGTLVQLTGVA